MIALQYLALIVLAVAGLWVNYQAIAIGDEQREAE